MIHLELDITDIDFETLADTWLPVAAERPGVKNSALGPFLIGGAGMAKTLLLKAPRGTQEKLAAELINSSAQKVTEAMERAFAQKGVPCTISGLHAEKK